MKYIEIPEGKRHSYAPMVKGFLEMTERDMKEHYRKYKEYLKENNQEVEFSKLHFISKSNAMEELDRLTNPKRPYLRDLLYMDSHK